jgi:hypothetical protein
MPTLTDPELLMVADVVTEMARLRGRAFDKNAKGEAFARAALIDPAFKARLAEVHRRLEERADPTRIAPMFRDLERDAADPRVSLGVPAVCAILSGGADRRGLTPSGRRLLVPN